MNSATLQVQQAHASPITSRRTLRRTWALLLGAIAVLIAFLAECAFGPMRINFDEIFSTLKGEVVNPAVTTTLWNIRLPRACMAILVGSALAIAGVAMQNLFRNPLADPALIGVSGGAAVAAVAVIVLFPLAVSTYVLPAASIAGCLIATITIFRLGRNDEEGSMARMLLVGIAINALGSAMIGFLLFLADDQQLRGFIFWSLGSLARAGWREVFITILVVVPMAWIIWRQREALNALLLGEAEALHLGWSPTKVRMILIFSSALLVGVTVAFCGMIGFIGLVVPHLVRLILGPDHRWLLPGSALVGAALLTGSDLFARLLVIPAELPLGVITSLLGAPFFLWLMRRGAGEVKL